MKTYRKETKMMAPILLTSAAVPHVLESLGFFTKLADAFRNDDEIKIEWTAPDYELKSFLWGLYKHERGERKTFLIRGKPGFCAAVLREMSTSGNHQVLEPRPRSIALRRALNRL